MYNMICIQVENCSMNIDCVHNISSLLERGSALQSQGILEESSGKMGVEATNYQGKLCLPRPFLQKKG